jgi:hypothetical protein
LHRVKDPYLVYLIHPDIMELRREEGQSAKFHSKMQESPTVYGERALHICMHMFLCT